MGCCFSWLKKTQPEKLSSQRQQHEKKQQPQRVKRAFARQLSDRNGAVAGAPAFSEFSLAELKAATDEFSSNNIISESGDKAPNVVYKGKLKNRRLIAVKKFKKNAWPDPKQFAVGHLFLARLLGYI